MTTVPSRNGSTSAEPLTLARVEAAIRASWDADTCDPVDLPWSRDNPSRGQCGVTALVLNDLLGGALLVAEVLLADGRRQGWHTWNVLGDGVEVDLTYDQFRAGETVQPAERVARPPGPPRREPARYELLRDRVRARLGLEA